MGCTYKNCKRQLSGCYCCVKKFKSCENHWSHSANESPRLRRNHLTIRWLTAQVSWWWVPWLWLKRTTKLITFVASWCAGQQSPILKYVNTTTACSARKHSEKWFRRKYWFILEYTKLSGNVICVSFWGSLYCGCVVWKNKWLPKPACSSHLISCLSNFDGKPGWMLVEFTCYCSICGAHWSGLTATRARSGASSFVVVCLREHVFICLWPWSCSVLSERRNWKLCIFC